MCTMLCSYNTYNQHYKEVQCFQQQVEPLLVKYGVNFVFFGEHSPDAEYAAQTRHTWHWQCWECSRQLACKALTFVWTCFLQGMCMPMSGHGL